MSGLKVRGILGIYDITDKNNVEELVKMNAVHEGNMIFNIAQSLAIGGDRFSIGWIGFGDGGSSIADTGRISYRPTNTSLARNDAADLYNRTFQKHRDDAGFNISVSPVSHDGAISDINMDFILGMGEPSGQLPMDNSGDFGNDFIFDEIGLFSNEASVAGSRLLTHVIFHPIQKSLNRTLQIKYTLRFEIV